MKFLNVFRLTNITIRNKVLWSDSDEDLTAVKKKQTRKHGVIHTSSITIPTTSDSPRILSSSITIPVSDTRTSDSSGAAGYSPPVHAKVLVTQPLVVASQTPARSEQDSLSSPDM